MQQNKCSAIITTHVNKFEKHVNKLLQIQLVNGDEQICKHDFRQQLHNELKC